jgi:hypothetical protein
MPRVGFYEPFRIDVDVPSLPPPYRAMQRTVKQNREKEKGRKKDRANNWKTDNGNGFFFHVLRGIGNQLIDSYVLLHENVVVLFWIQTRKSIVSIKN